MSKVKSFTNLTSKVDQLNANLYKDNERSVNKEVESML